MIKKGLRVKILVGKDKNKEGEVIEIDRQNNRAKVKDINIFNFSSIILSIYFNYFTFFIFIFSN